MTEIENGVEMTATTIAFLNGASAKLTIARDWCDAEDTSEAASVGVAELFDYREEHNYLHHMAQFSLDTGSSEEISVGLTCYGRDYAEANESYVYEIEISGEGWSSATDDEGGAALYAYKTPQAATEAYGRLIAALCGQQADDFGA